MKNSPFKKRLSYLKKDFEDKNIDMLWIVQPENRQYLSGFMAHDTQLNESSGSLLISRKKNQLITDSRYTVVAKREAPDFRVITQKGAFQDELVKQVERAGGKTIGFEGDHVIFNLYNDLLKRFKKSPNPVKMKNISGMIEKMREVKDASEIAIMERASKMMSEVLDRVIDSVVPGQTEKEIARMIHDLSIEAGAEGMAFESIVASGPNAALPHAVPTDRKIKKRDHITFDVGLKVNGYCCDMTRTVFIGKPERKIKEIYKIVREAQLNALEYVRPGEMSTRPDSVARDIIGRAGYGSFFGHSLGHGVGLATHEAPRLSPRNPVKLIEGMVVTVEPGIYLPGKGGVRLEEMVVIGKRGPRILTMNRRYYDF
ncbi:MAG: aminopeptidase P family protein [Deltaproteobacteria bacterium]|nr:aminopeptidase P family protein [Deltaproteobacteria bacterium]